MGVEVDERVKGLFGGSKQVWLRVHHEEVLRFYFANGANDTMQRFNMRPFTFERFLIAKYPKFEKVSTAEKALMKSEEALEANRDIRHRLNDIEAVLEEMLPMVQLGYGFLTAVARMMPALELVNTNHHFENLNLSDIGGKLKKQL